MINIRSARRVKNNVFKVYPTKDRIFSLVLIDYRTCLVNVDFFLDVAYDLVALTHDVTTDALPRQTTARHEVKEDIAQGLQVISTRLFLALEATMNEQKSGFFLQLCVKLRLFNTTFGKTQVDF